MKKFIQMLKEGFPNIGIVLSEGNAKIFLRPVIVAAIICGGLYYYNGQNEELIRKANSESSAHKKTREQMLSYSANKDSVAQMEQFFPDYVERNEWLRTYVIEIFKRHSLQHTFSGTQTQDEAGNLAGTYIGFTFKAPYEEAGKLLAEIENNEKFIKITELTFAKNDKEVGTSDFTIKTAAVFVKDKLGEKKK
ncbi:hypothetical protein Dip510_001271 [Elusimicrobium posterum]|uniref:hypothetical protein n=1 Tax=Elusimicrobium posterum TaxID=3116653 RepID=UPI003C772C8C